MKVLHTIWYYSPHLNIAERLWKELKARWLSPADYLSTDQLFYAVNLALAAVGKGLFINFADYQLKFNVILSRYLTNIFWGYVALLFERRDQMSFPLLNHFSFLEERNLFNANLASDNYYWPAYLMKLMVL